MACHWQQRRAKGHIPSSVRDPGRCRPTGLTERQWDESGTRNGFPGRRRLFFVACTCWRATAVFCPNPRFRHSSALRQHRVVEPEDRKRKEHSG